MKILALIPARKGSKRLPGKNMLLLGGKPLISWTIDIAKEIKEFCDIVASTDDLEVAEHCVRSGIMVPWLRPHELATDEASLVDVTLHALNWYESINGDVDCIVLLQPTSPFRKAETIRRGIQLFEDHKLRTVLGVSKSDTHPMWMFNMQGDLMLPYLDKHGMNMRSQDLPDVYSLNGYFYMTSTQNLRESRSFIQKESVPLVIESKRETLDIDDQWDFQMAEYIIKISQG